MRKMSKIPEFKKKKIKVKTKIEYQLKRSKNCFFFFGKKMEEPIGLKLKGPAFTSNLNIYNQKL
jgi:hypothetical protein